MTCRENFERAFKNDSDQKKLDPQSYLQKLEPMGRRPEFFEISSSHLMFYK